MDKSQIQSRSCCSVQKYFALTLVSIGLFIVSLIVAFVVIPIVINTQIAKNVRLEYDTDQYERFLKLPFPLRFAVYLFQVENPEGILRGDKPKLTEIGPFVYDEIRVKTEHFLNDTEDTISYTTNITFKFNKELSNGLEETQMITVLNPPYWTTYQVADQQGLTSAVAGCMQYYFATFNGIFIKTTVRQLLFDGIKFMDHYGGIVCGFEYDIVYGMSATKKFVDKVPDGTLKFSYLNYKMRSNDGLYTVNRGIDDISKLGSIVRLNNETHTKYWSNGTATCDEVKGTDSTIYAPHIKTDTVLQAYSTDICRYVDIHYQRESSYKNVPGYQFGTSNQTLRPSTTTPKNDCFCTQQTKDINGKKDCYLDGLLDLQSCVGAPTLLSFPRFLYAEQYLKYVEMPPPNADLHGSSLIVERNTGTPLTGYTRIQFNMVLRPIKGAPDTVNISRSVLPLFWIEEGFALPDKYVNLLENMYFKRKNIAEILKWAFIGVTAAMVVIFTPIYMRLRFCS